MGRTKKEKEADCWDCVECDKVMTGRRRDVINHVIYMHMGTDECRFVCLCCDSSSHPLKGPFCASNITKMTKHLKTSLHRKNMTDMGLSIDKVLILFENKYSKIFQKHTKKKTYFI